MCMCIHICIHICIRIYDMCTYVHIYERTKPARDRHRYMYMYMYIYIHVYVYTCIHVNPCRIFYALTLRGHQVDLAVALHMLPARADSYAGHI